MRYIAWCARNDIELLRPLYNRVVEMVNYHAGMNIRVEGQEYFTIIHFHIPKGRVATAVLYCQKWITTAWLREGVTAEENADLYDPEGIRILAESEFGSNDQES
eukprot:gene37514-50641_t